jgi:hypothetical protein
LVRYFKVIGYTLSILFNAFLGGQYNQTFSARNWCWKRQGKFNLVFIIDAINIEKDHCMMSYARWLFIERGIKEINDLHNRLEDRKFYLHSR